MQTYLTLLKLFLKAVFYIFFEYYTVVCYSIYFSIYYFILICGFARMWIAYEIYLCRNSFPGLGHILKQLSDG